VCAVLSRSGLLAHHWADVGQPTLTCIVQVVAQSFFWWRCNSVSSCELFAGMSLNQTVSSRQPPFLPHLRPAVSLHLARASAPTQRSSAERALGCFRPSDLHERVWLRHRRDHLWALSDSFRLELTAPSDRPPGGDCAMVPNHPTPYRRPSLCLLSPDLYGSSAHPCSGRRRL
jgi:hypothetical protein